MTPPTIHRTSTGTHYFENMRTKNWQRQTIGEIRADFRLLGFTEEETDTALTKARHENAVDDVIQLEGKPRGITGFQTHTTPVLLGVGDRAELGTEEYLAKSPILEGCVILVKNPNYKPDEME